MDGELDTQAGFDDDDVFEEFLAHHSTFWHDDFQEEAAPAPAGPTPVLHSSSSHAGAEEVEPASKQPRLEEDASEVLMGPGSSKQSFDEGAMRQAILRELWQKQVPFLYDFLAIHRHDYLAASLAWCTGSAELQGNHLQRLIVGACSQQDSRHGQLMLLMIRLPWQDNSKEMPKVQVTHCMPHDGPVKCIACSPHRKTLVSTQTQQGDVLLFNFSRWRPRRGGASCASECSPDLRLSTPAEHRDTDSSVIGALSWHPRQAAQLLASLPGGFARLWDLEAQTHMAEFSCHEKSTVTGINFSKESCSFFATSGMDGAIRLWDPRNSVSSVSEVASAHPGGSTCIAFEHGSGLSLATGGIDGVVSLWDIRNFGSCLHTFDWARGDRASVSSLTWAPLDGVHVLACGRSNGRVLLWDVDAHPVSRDEADPPELLFSHGGHIGCSAAGGLAWNPEAPWLLASAVGLSPNTGAVLEQLPSGATVAGEMHFWRPAAAFRKGQVVSGNIPL